MCGQSREHRFAVGFGRHELKGLWGRPSADDVMAGVDGVGEGSYIDEDGVG